MQGVVLYNIFDSRNEGTATGVEEMLMHAGLYDDSLRSSGSWWRSEQRHQIWQLACIENTVGGIIDQFP